MITGSLSVSVGTPAGPAPDSELISVEWWAIPRTGSPFVMADIDDFEISGIAGSRGAIAVDVPVHTPLCEQLLALTSAIDSDLEVEIRLFGGHARSLRGFLQASDGDEVAETGQRRFAGSLVAQRVYEAVLFPNPVDEKGETRFAASNAGQIIHSLISTAKARGALADISTATFNTSFDSRGTAWDRVTTVTLSPGSPYGEILEELQEQGLCEWEVNGARELRLYVPGSRGLDRTTGTPATGLVVLHRGRDLVDAGRTHNVRDAITALLVAGKDGLYESRSNTAAQTKRGRRIEGYASNGQIDEALALGGYTELKLATQSVGQVEISHGLVVNGPGPQPFLDFDLGDWVWSDTGRGAGPEKVRVQQISLTRQSKELSATAVVGNLSMSTIVSLSRRLTRLERGAAVVGTSVDPALSTGEDTVPPAAPTGLVATSDAFLDPSGATMALVTAGWEAVTSDERHLVGDPAIAADLIADRFASGQPVLADWTWTSAPPIVNAQNDALLALYAPGDPTNRENSEAWLRDYVTDHTVDGAATDDVAGYRVRIAYAGMQQVSFQGQPADELAYQPVTGNEGTTATQYTFPATPGVEISIQVMAFDRSGNSSVWSAPLIHITAVDNTPPQRPSTPILSTWFRTLDVFWDGLDAFGAPMPADFDRVAIIVSQEAAPTVPAVLDRPVDFDPTNTIGQYVANLYAGGTHNVANLPIGIGFYAVIVALDDVGNRSLTSVPGGPAVAEQLVHIDVGPNAIDRSQIIDGEIVRAKIGDLAVNTAKCEELSVGVLTAGTMSARVLMAGIIETATTGQRMRIANDGLRLYNTTDTLIGSWNTTDGSMLMTGTYQSGLAGSRINILPNGTQRFYLPAGLAYSEIANDGTNGLRMRGPATGPQIDAGYVYLAPDNATVTYGRQMAPISSDPRARVDNAGVQTFGAINGFRILLTESIPVGGNARSVFMATQNSSYIDITGSVLHYLYVNGAPVWGAPAQASGLVFGGDIVFVTDGVGTAGSRRPISATSFQVASALALKTEVTPALEANLTAADIVRRAPIRSYYLRSEQAPRSERPGHLVQNAAGEWVPGDWAHPQPVARRHIGPIADELLALHPELVANPDAPTDELRIDLLTVASVAWAAAAEAHDRIEQLERLLEAQ